MDRRNQIANKMFDRKDKNTVIYSPIKRRLDIKDMPRQEIRMLKLIKPKAFWKVWATGAVGMVEMVRKA